MGEDLGLLLDRPPHTVMYEMIAALYEISLG
jgi:hypothetical protein